MDRVQTSEVGVTRSLVRFRLPGQGVSRLPRQDDSLSRLLSAPVPGGGRDDCLSRVLLGAGRVKTTESR